MDVFQNLLRAVQEDAILGLSSTESKPSELFQTQIHARRLKKFTRSRFHT